MSWCGHWSSPSSGAMSLVTVRGRPHSPAIGALVREAMRTQWLGAAALAVQKSRARDGGKMH